MRFVLHLIIALFLSIVETSFFASFHGIIRFTPFVFAVSVYLLQHHSIHSAASWMLIHGLFLDITHISQTPFIFIAYLVAAIVAVMSAEKIFSNRSFYGVMGCVFLSYASFTFMECFLREFAALLEKHPFYIQTYLQDLELRFLMLFVSLFVLFAFAKHIRFLIKNSFLLPRTHQTF